MQYLRGQLGYALGFSHHHQRDLYQQFGYPRLLTLDDLWMLYQRNDIATRIIRAFPQASWRDHPLIRDAQGSSPNEEDEDYSAFVAAIDALFEQFQVIYHLEKADRLASIGQYGLLVCGFNDQAFMDQPLKGNANLIYLQAYMQRNITVSQWDTDPKSERFGKPNIYTVQSGTFGIQQASATKSFRVHHSRVIHISEYLDQDDTFGMPRLEPIYNRLKDVEKVMGGASEMYWLNASRGVALTADPDANISDDALDNMEEQLEEFDHQLRRNLALQGVTATQLQATIEDCSPVMENLLNLIAGTVGIPKRILLGTEAGQLASGQDENNWADRTNERRRSFAGPRILKPFVRMMIDTGNLPKPVEQFWIDWPDSAATPERQANLGNTRTTMVRNYLSTPGAEILVPAAEFRKDFLGLPPVSEYEESDTDEELLQFTSAPPAPEGEQAPLDESDPEVKAQFKKSKTNSAPKTLYVYRPVENADEIIAHYKAQGVETTMSADDLHVTIMYSKTPVDWMKANPDYAYTNDVKDREAGIIRIIPGGPRDNDIFGSPFPGSGNKCLVLLFKSLDLQWRHSSLLGLGCSYEFDTFQPHVTITWDPGDIDLDDIEAWQGEIVLGPEQFERIDPNWKSKIVENKVAKMQRHSIATTKEWRSNRMMPVNYSPDQERDDNGEFGSGGGGSDTPKGVDETKGERKTSTAEYFGMKDALASKFPRQAASKDLDVLQGPTYYVAEIGSKQYRALTPKDGKTFTFTEGKSKEGDWYPKKGGKTFTMDVTPRETTTNAKPTQRRKAASVHKSVHRGQRSTKHVSKR